MPRRGNKSSGPTEASGTRFPWTKIAGTLAASILASGAIRRLPFGRLVVASAPFIIAALQDKDDRSRRSTKRPK